VGGRGWAVVDGRSWLGGPPTLPAAYAPPMRPLPLLLLPLLACGRPPAEETSVGREGADAAAEEPDPTAVGAPAQVTGVAVSQDALPAALRERFRVLDDTLEEHGEGRVPRVIEHRATGLAFVFVPAGTFTLGSDADDPDRFDDERPPRRVRMSGFYVGRTETTAEAWRRGGGTAGAAVGDDHPIQGVTWLEALAWCEANGLALPSEAQWEYAASGPRDDLYPWGYAPGAKGRANAAGTNESDLWVTTAPVGSFPDGDSWCGARDLAGNVMEWCRDPWTPDHTAVPRDALDPVATVAGKADERVVRGGSYEATALVHLRSAYRNRIPPDLAGGNLGFRPVAPAF